MGDDGCNSIMRTYLSFWQQQGFVGFIPKERRVVELQENKTREREREM